MRPDGFGLSSADTLITLQRLHSLAFGFGTFAFAKDRASLPHDGLLKDNPPPLPIRYRVYLYRLASTEMTTGVEWTMAWRGKMKLRWDASLAGRRIIHAYILSRKARQNAQMRFPEHAIVRPRETEIKLLTKPTRGIGGIER